MQEGQVTIGDVSFPLPQPFLVLATQNPLEHEGTYPLPEAQVDRFMLKLNITYPSREEELQILERMAHTQSHTDIKAVVTTADILAARSVVDAIYLDDKVKQYIVAGDDLPGTGGESLCLPQGQRLRNPARREVHWYGRAAPSRAGHVRSGSGRDHG
jgi:MoxR-like ATPase